MRELFRYAFATARNPRLLALHIVGNAIVLAAASLWMLIPEERWWQLLGAAGSALVLAAAFLWFHSSALAYGADSQPANLRAALRPTISKFLWLLLGLAILFWCMRGVDGWTESQPQVSVYLYAKSPSWLRPTSGSSSLYHLVGWVIAIIYCYLLPCLMLPWIAAKVTGGKFLAGLRTLLHWRYWLGMAIAALVGIGLTQLLVGWHPGHTLRAQSVSLIIRFVIAYALAVLAWLAAAGVLGYFVGPQRTGDVVALPDWFRHRLFRRGGESHALVRQSIAVLRDWRLLALQLVAYFILLASGMLTDRIDPGRVGQIVVAVISGLILLFLFLWLQSGTLAYAVDPVPERFRTAFRIRLRPMAWLLLGISVFLLLAIGVEVLIEMVVAGASIRTGTTDVFSWYLLPLLLLPWTAAKVTGAGLRSGGRALSRWRYWVAMAVVVAAAGSLSSELPALGVWTGVLRGERFVFARLGLEELPIVIGWIVVAALVGYFVGVAHGGALENSTRKAVV